MFETGNFSAKYLKNTADESKKRREESPMALPISRTGSPQPISFNKLDPSSLIDERISSSRKESLLSASISKSYANMSQSINAQQMTKIVERHLSSGEGSGSVHSNSNSIEPAGTNYSSMKKPSGFLTRDIENWVHERKDSQVLRRTLSSGSLDIESRRSADVPDARDLHLPNGFRRNFIELNKKQPNRGGRYTKNFFEFLSLYGNFAGEDLRDEDDSELETEDDFDDEEHHLGGSTFEEDEEEEDDDFENALVASNEEEDDERMRLWNPDSRGSFNNHLQSRIPTSKKIRTKNKNASKKGKTTTFHAFLLLLKAFLGTGIIFLPKAFSNGGLAFCNVMIILFSLISYYCFVILINTTKELGVSGYGDAGYKIFGKGIRTLILLSLVLSQLGFSSSYVVFVGSNLREMYNLVWDQDLSIKGFILYQLILFLPISLTRKISKLGFCALIADVFIFMGLIYIYSQSTINLFEHGISKKIQYFNSESWSLFIGTAVFAYEGIGLLIPIKESMKNPEQFNKLLILVMIIVTLVFTSLASLAYLSYGDDVKTVILMNFPHNSLTLTIQFCYSIAILLSTPLQIFPAIKIVEFYLFHKDRSTWKGKIRRNSEAISVHSNNLLMYGSINAPSINPGNPNLINQEGLLSGKSDTFIKAMKNILRIGIVLVMTLIAYLGSDHLDKFVSLVGSFTCIPLIYIYPPVMYLGCFRGKTGFVEQVACWTILILGVSLMVYTSIDTIVKW